jgi:outer membrane protein
VYVEYNKELQKKQGELTKPIFQRAMGIIRRIASKEGFDVVVDKQAVPYVRSDLDLTDRVISMYNRGDTSADDETPKSADSKTKAVPKGEKKRTKKRAPR